MTKIRTTVNGTPHEHEVEPRLLLVHYLRDVLGLTGTNIGCDTSHCGACTVHRDGRAVKSCTVLAVQVDGQEIETVEGLAEPVVDDRLAPASSDASSRWHPMQRSFHEEHALQCGFCTPGMMMAAIELLDHNPQPSDSEIREGLKGNICRCTGYVNIVKAVRRCSSQPVDQAPYSESGS